MLKRCPVEQGIVEDENRYAMLKALGLKTTHLLLKLQPPMNVQRQIENRVWEIS
jgi:hypothetical protein